MVDWTKTKIQQALATANPPIFRFRDLDKRAKLTIGATQATINAPHKAGEKAISAAIGVEPKIIWPSRYHPDGKRKRPQPRENYTYETQPGHVKSARAV